MKEKGAQWPIVASVGEWRSLAFMGYVDISLDVARDMAKLLIEREELSEDEVRHWVTGPRARGAPPVGIGGPLFAPS